MLRRNSDSNVIPFLEQCVCPALQRALNAFVADNRPSHPCMSDKQSALTYIALCLKARNEFSAEQTRLGWQHKLELFLEDCTHSVYIHKNAVRGSPRRMSRGW